MAPGRKSAHYEFICKQKGVKVAYCAEQFDNDGSLCALAIVGSRASGFALGGPPPSGSDEN
jgi:hypothetical protein